MLQPYGSAGFRIFNSTESGEWEILKTEVDFVAAQYDTSETFSSLTCRLFIKRKSGYFILNVLVPSVMFTIVEAATFSIPFDSENRLDVSFTCLLAYSFFLNIVASMLPRDNDNTPLLLIYIACMMAYILMAIGFQSYTLYLSRFGKKGKEIPMILVKIFIKNWFKKKELFVSGAIGNDNEWQRKIRIRMWMKVVARLDQTGLIFFLILITLTPLIVFLIIPSMLNKIEV